MNSIQNSKDIVIDAPTITRDLRDISSKLVFVGQQIEKLRESEDTTNPAQRADQKHLQEEQIQLLKSQVENAVEALKHTRRINTIVIIVNVILAACTVFTTLYNVGLFRLK